MSRAINETSNFKSAKLWIIVLSSLLSFFKKGDTIQGEHYLRKCGNLQFLTTEFIDSSNMVWKVTVTESLASLSNPLA